MTTLSDHVRKLAKKLKIDENKKTDSSFITSRIIIGNYKVAEDEKFFKTKKIKAVLNCTNDLPNSFQKKEDIEYMRIPVDDSLKVKDINKMYEFMPSITQFIHKHAHVQKNNILIHCVEGSQRSVAAVVVYFIEMHKMDPYKACEKVLSKRHKAFHHGNHVNFEKAIDKYHKKMNTKCKK